MDADVRQMVNLTVAEVFQTMFFTFLEPLDDVPLEGDWEPDVEFVMASIAHTGALTGEYNFYFPMRLAKDITLNFLGIDESELEQKQIVDTVAEVANMTVGSLLGKRDPLGACTLGIPTAKVLENFSPKEILGEGGLVVFQSNNGHLWLVCKE